MKQILKHQTRRNIIALTAMVSFVTLGTGTVPAAPPGDTPTFDSADISIEPRGEEAGGLTCSWRESGLGSYQVVYYTCEAGTVAALEGCIYKNKLITNTPTRLSVFKDVAGEHGQPVPFLSKNNGQINDSTTTTIPESHGVGELCVEPTVAAILAVRWCNAQLTDTTNHLLGSTKSELYQEFISGGGEVPSCEVLATTPSS